jgi:hypothetical protein
MINLQFIDQVGSGGEYHGTIGTKLIPFSKYLMEAKAELIDLACIYEELGEIDISDVNGFNDELRAGLILIVEGIEDSFPQIRSSLSSLELMDSNLVLDVELGDVYSRVGDDLVEIETFVYGIEFIGDVFLTGEDL